LTLNIGLGLMRQVVELAKQAGEEIMKVYNSGFTVKTKADDSPVTQADRIAETLITETIKKEISAQFPVVGEEAFADGKVADVTGTPFWLVDALDGTKEFVKLGSEFTVNIALIDIGKPMLPIGAVATALLPKPTARNPDRSTVGAAPAMDWWPWSAVHIAHPRWTNIWPSSP
jgi:3'(2'), 5'-bisphosphate nucleotidase